MKKIALAIIAAITLANSAQGMVANDLNDNKSELVLQAMLNANISKLEIKPETNTTSSTLAPEKSSTIPFGSFKVTYSLKPAIAYAIIRMTVPVGFSIAMYAIAKFAYSLHTTI
ncbi:hypothetical protein KJ644_01645 [Candidatus Dependentiae bacterium]|nr:hypothetical protein [Candidatus Dependentiae bacterium]MBU4387155.1 hypothetical protein [Candidatus Dependentiae bacterium]MCG2756740.1 hypothetical protein [Candidatus Dependentiae bacterium]